MSRSYAHCDVCGKRMKKFFEEKEDDGRIFYYCPHCSRSTGTYVKDINGWLEGWPEEIYAEAISRGLFTQERLLKK